MDNKEIRRQKMLVLAAELGGLQALADRTKTDAKYLSQVKNRWQGRGMGDDVARRFEEALGKDNGWMDRLDGLPPEAERVGRRWDSLPEPLKTQWRDAIFATALKIPEREERRKATADDGANPWLSKGHEDRRRNDRWAGNTRREE